MNCSFKHEIKKESLCILFVVLGQTLVNLSIKTILKLFKNVSSSEKIQAIYIHTQGIWEHKATVYIHKTEILQEEGCTVAPLSEVMPI